MSRSVAFWMHRKVHAALDAADLDPSARRLRTHVATWKAERRHASKRNAAQSIKKQSADLARWATTLADREPILYDCNCMSRVAAELRSKERKRGDFMAKRQNTAWTFCNARSISASALAATDPCFTFSLGLTTFLPSTTRLVKGTVADTKALEDEGVEEDNRDGVELQPGMTMILWAAAAGFSST